MLLRNALLARRLIFTVGSGFALTLLLIAAITLLGLRQLESTNARLETIVHEHSVKTRMATQMRDILRDRAISMLSIAVINEAFEKDEEMLRFYSYGSAYQKVRLDLEPLIVGPREKSVLANIDSLTRLNQPVMVHIVDLALEGYTFLAFDALQKEGIPLQRQLVKELDALVQIQRDMTQRATIEARANYTKTRNLIIFLGLLAIGIAALVAWVVVRRTARLAADTEREATKFQTLFETNTDGIVILNDQGFIDCNTATLNMFHMQSKSEFLAHRPPDLGEDPQQCGTPAALLAEKHIHDAIRTGHAHFQWTARRPDGSGFPAHIELHAMMLDGKNVIQAIMRDVSVQKETEDTLRSARDAALSATEMKSQFVANVSHEIRTPMNGIMGMTQLLLATPLSVRQKEYVDAVSRSAEALMRVINDLLDFSKIEAGRLSLEVVDFDLSAQLRDILELYIPRADAKQLALRLERRDGKTALPAWVRGDPLRIRQILLNLLDNAIKFTRQGEVRLIVEPVEGCADHICFSVRDTGQGMSAEVQERVFQAFSQGDGSVTRKFGGTGLGLTICRQLAELMGGSLTLESQQDVGSTFHLTLPLSRARPGQSEQALTTACAHFPGARVLVAEDNPVNQKLARYMLENLKVEVLLAGDGRIAFDRLKQEHAEQKPVDLIFMDFQMPEWDGLTATRAIRAWEQEQALPRLPIIALTANAMTGFEETCRQAGMDGFLTKPLHEDELVSSLSRWIPEKQSIERILPETSAGTFAEEEAARSGALYQREKIHKLCRNNPAQIAEMLELFVSSTEPLLAALCAAIADQDAPKAVRQAHQIKGAAAYLGADPMTQHASQAEQYAKRGDLDACAEATDELEAAFIALCRTLEEEIQVLGQKPGTPD